ncbi:unnamed protein product [Paramecium sonneborni]|uniref:Uncharacterized protein n=1 Tax=Paramecium sonneborni TaxID=65129 RepID=A0A8S1RT55_9CILI|nr:unnamed protein product [Paramecium sonneborni]
MQRLMIQNLIIYQKENKSCQYKIKEIKLILNLENCKTYEQKIYLIINLQINDGKSDLRQVSFDKFSEEKEIIEEQVQKLDKKQQFSTQQLKLDIYQFFEDLDTIQLKYFTQQQMFFDFLKIGVLIKGQTLMQQKPFDYGGFEKFYIVINNNILQSQKLIYLLKQEFDQFKKSETDVVVFKKVNLNVKFENVIFIYKTLDRQRSSLLGILDEEGDFLIVSIVIQPNNKQQSNYSKYYYLYYCNYRQLRVCRSIII